NVDSIVLHYSPHSIDCEDINKLTELARKRYIQLSFIMPVPVWDKHVPMALWKNLKGLEEIPSQNINDYQNFNQSLISVLANIHYDKFRVYQIADVFCKSACSLISESGRPLYFDSGHLTLTGSKMLRGVFDRVIADLL